MCSPSTKRASTRHFPARQPSISSGIRMAHLAEFETRASLSSLAGWNLLGVASPLYAVAGACWLPVVGFGCARAGDGGHRSSRGYTASSLVLGVRALLDAGISRLRRTTHCVLVDGCQAVTVPSNDITTRAGRTSRGGNEPRTVGSYLDASIGDFAHDCYLLHKTPVSTCLSTGRIAISLELRR